MNFIFGSYTKKLLIFGDNFTLRMIRLFICLHSERNSHLLNWIKFLETFLLQNKKCYSTVNALINFNFKNVQKEKIEFAIRNVTKTMHLCTVPFLSYTPFFLLYFFCLLFIYSFLLDYCEAKENNKHPHQDSLQFLTSWLFRMIKIFQLFVYYSF